MPSDTVGHTLPLLEPLEVCSGIVLGKRRSPRSRSAPPTRPSTVRGVLEDLVVPRLETSPCYVSFSGGRDSAALLSLATRLARERGLPDPVPVTLRFENRPRTDENEWQEITIDHLGLGRWELIAIGDELDPLGPVASSLLRRHGLYWPPVAHRIAPLLDVARGHAIIFGTGGDEVFSPWARHAARGRLGVRGRPFGKAARRVAFNLLPERVRISIRLRRRKDLSWLRPVARREVERQYKALMRRRTPTWAGAIRGVPDSRNFELTQSIFAALARDAEVSLIQPFFDPGFIRVLGESAPLRGFPSRAEAMELHFGDVLPPRLLERTTKAVFDELHGGRESRAFAEKWDGGGLDPALVDLEALRAEWLKPRPEYRSITALNAAWLASQDPRS
ncbi:MAG TPA: asparagine synthase-related protein [Gemmatimonadota bacterium]|nr:asparagine synthase-related protein [Gemmatimonadota bacterium]